MQSKNTRKSLRYNSSAPQTVSGRSSSDEPMIRVYFGRPRNPAAKKNLLGARSWMGKLRQCVTGRARARACGQQDSSAPMPMSISGGSTAEDDDVLGGGGTLWRTAAGGQTAAAAVAHCLCCTVRATTPTTYLLHAARVTVDGRSTREACVLLVCVDLAAAAREVEQTGSRYRLLAA